MNMGYLNTPYGLIEIQAVLKIVFESSNIVETSNSPGTVIKRCFLLKDNYNYLIEIRSQPGFAEKFEESINDYKQTYFVNPVTEIQRSIIIAAKEDHYKLFFFVHIERSFYKYIDQQLHEILSLKKKDAREKRISKLYDLLVNCNTEMLKLFMPIEKDDPYWNKIPTLNRLLTNYVELKLNSFDESLILQVNGAQYEDENKAPINDVAKKL